MFAALFVLTLANGIFTFVRHRSGPILRPLFVTLGVMVWLFIRAAREVEQRQRLLDLADAHGFPLDERRAARAVAAGQAALLEERIRAAG